MAKSIKVIPASVHKFTATPFSSTQKKRVAGYARVSTELEEQQSSYEAQLDYYTNYIQSNPDWEFVEVYADEGISATTTKNRDGFNRMIQDALDGKIDLIVTKSVSRFARNTKDLLELIEQLRIKGVAFRSVKESIDTATPAGKFMLTVFAAVAELERNYLLQRQAEGITQAKAAGKYKGRKPKEIPEFEQVIAKWRRGDVTAASAIKMLGISKSSFYRKSKEHN